MSEKKRTPGTEKSNDPKVRAKEYLGERGISGDTWNIVSALNLCVDNSSLWHLITSVETYERYIKERSLEKDIADEVIAMSDKKLVTELNEILGRINACIAIGVSDTQAQINEELDKAYKVIYGENRPQ